MGSYGGWSENIAELPTAACSQASPASTTTTASPAIRNDQLHAQNMAWKREESRYYLAGVAAHRISAGRMWHGRGAEKGEGKVKTTVADGRVLLPRPKAMILAEETRRKNMMAGTSAKGVARRPTKIAACATFEKRLQALIGAEVRTSGTPRGCRKRGYVESS